jgi:hypothetical protein
VHGAGGCVPPVESVQQWGEWLRALRGRSTSMKEGSQRAAPSSTKSHG